VAVRGSVETDRNCLRRNSQAQFYAFVAIPLFHKFITSDGVSRPDPFLRVSKATHLGHKPIFLWLWTLQEYGLVKILYFNEFFLL